MVQTWPATGVPERRYVWVPPSVGLGGLLAMWIVEPAGWETVAVNGAVGSASMAAARPRAIVLRVLWSDGRPLGAA